MSTEPGAKYRWVWSEETWERPAGTGEPSELSHGPTGPKEKLQA